MTDKKPKDVTIWNRQAKDKQEILKNLRQMPIIQVAVQRAGVSRSAYYEWRQDDENFRKAADEAIKEGENFISDMSESQLISLIKDKKFSAIQMWLKTHHPKYANRLEINGKLITQEDEELSPEEAEIQRQALLHMGYKKKYVRTKQQQ